MNNSKLKIVVIGVIIYIFSTLISYFVFAKVISGSSLVTSPVPEPEKGQNGNITFDQTLPKTEECPLNGEMYSKQQKKWWEKHRPLGVMIENHQESRPQSGISKSDVVYEAVAEGGITRFLTVFYCNNAEFIGPVRSARTYFLDFISEYADYPLYAHVGGANTDGPANALGQIEKYGWQSYNDLNQFSIGFPTFWRDYERLGHEVATEHTMYSTTERLWKLAEQRKLTNVDKSGKKWDANFVQYSFKDDAASDSRPASQTISFAFWNGYDDYGVKWDYDSVSNSYLRTNGGQKHLDLNNKEQLTAKDVVILFMRESRANDGYEGNLHMLYGTKGTGKATIFMDGKQIQGTWSKKDRTARTIIKDNTGKEVKFTRGRIWFEILAIGSAVSVN